MSRATRALVNIRVSEKHLPVDEPYHSWTLDARRRNMRNSLIYKHYLESKDKVAQIKLLAERYGLTQGKIKSIVEDMKKEDAVVPALAANIEVLKRFKRAEVLGDYNGLRSEIEAQVEALRVLKDGPDGSIWIEIEESEEVGGKFGGKTTTKRVKIDTEIRRLLTELAKSHPDEAKALADYGTKAGDVDPHDMARVIGASAEFLEQLSRIQEMSKNRPIDVEAEIIQ